jgi:hypothetical protein
VVFDAAQAGFRAWWVFVPFLGVGLIGLRLSLMDRATPGLRIMGRIMLVAGVMLGAVAEVATYRDYRRLRDALLAGRFVWVEGVVTQFIPGAPDGHPGESFCVASHCYSYSRGLVSPGFDHVSGQGGPVSAGLQVRIADVDGTIARLEIARDRRTSQRP